MTGRGVPQSGVGDDSFYEGVGVGRIAIGGENGGAGQVDIDSSSDVIFHRDAGENAQGCAAVYVRFGHSPLLRARCGRGRIQRARRRP